MLRFRTWCYSVAAGGSSELEHTLGLHSLCDDKLTPGTRNSAGFSPCAEEHKQGHAHTCCQAAVPALGDTGFTKFSVILRRFTEGFHTYSLMCLLQLKNLNQLHCYSRCVRSVWKHWKLRTFCECLHRAPDQQMEETSWHTVPFTGLNRLSLIHTHTHMCSSGGSLEYTI